MSSMMHRTITNTINSLKMMRDSNVSFSHGKLKAIIHPKIIIIITSSVMYFEAFLPLVPIHYLVSIRAA